MKKLLKILSLFWFIFSLSALWALSSKHGATNREVILAIMCAACMICGWLWLIREERD
jgi:hypothetical protein